MRFTCSSCDDCAAVINLPWTFPYYGRGYSQITVTSNGYLVLTPDPEGAGRICKWTGAPLCSPTPLQATGVRIVCSCIKRDRLSGV